MNDTNQGGRNIDPAALLMAVVVLAVGTLLEGGLWTIEDTMAAAVVIIVLYAYYGRHVRELTDRWQVRALGAVLALAGAVGIAYPTQVVMTADCRDFRPGEECTEADADEASLIALGVAFVVVASWVVLRERNTQAATT